MTAVLSSQWTAVCRLADLSLERGVAALLDVGQIALFQTHDGQVYAIGNRDPFSGANVLARGIVGSRGPAATVMSPMYKQAFDLRTGECLDDPAVSVSTYPVRLRDGVVEVASP